MFQPENFMGPAALLIGPLTEDSKERVAQLILRYANQERFDLNCAIVSYAINGKTEEFQTRPDSSKQDWQAIVVE